MGKKFWLEMAVNEALDILSAYGTTKTDDQALLQKMATAQASLKDLVNYLTSTPSK